MISRPFITRSYFDRDEIIPHKISALEDFLKKGRNNKYTGKAKISFFLFLLTYLNQENQVMK